MAEHSPDSLMAQLFVENRDLAAQLQAAREELEALKKTCSEGYLEFQSDVDQAIAEILEHGSTADRKSRVQTAKGSSFQLEYASLKQLKSIVLPILQKLKISMVENMYDHPTDPDRTIIETKLVRGPHERVSQLSVVSAFYQKKMSRSLTYFGSDVSMIRRYALRVLLGITDPDSTEQERELPNTAPITATNDMTVETAKIALSQVTTRADALSIMNSLSKEIRGAVAVYYNKIVKELGD